MQTSRTTYVQSTLAATIVLFHNPCALAMCLARGSQLREQDSVEWSRTMFEKSVEYPPISDDDTKLSLVIAKPNSDPNLPHIGLVETPTQSLSAETILITGSASSTCMCLLEADLLPTGMLTKQRLM